jgi:hypothetical protein
MEDVLEMSIKGREHHLNFVTGAGRPIRNQQNDSLPYRALSVPQKIVGISSGLSFI